VLRIAGAVSGNDNKTAHSGVIPAKAGIHLADNALEPRWIPAFASHRNFVPAGGRRSFASPRAGMTVIGLKDSLATLAQALTMKAEAAAAA
jgi:hypothetical protein